MISPVSDRPLNQPKIHTLANGLTIIAEQIPVEAVNLNLWLNVGSSLESDDINGMAHFLEHMIFKGTPHLDSGEFEKLIEERGAVTNAATSQEYTHYYITTAPQDFKTLAGLQVDVVLNPLLETQAFERERMVVLEEIRRSQDSPQRRTFYRAMETCFQNLPYRRPVLGPAAVISELSNQQMRQFHHHWYQPGNMTAAVVGNLPEAEMIAIVAENFERLYQTSLDLPPLDLSHLGDRQPETPFDQVVRCEYEDESLQQARLVMLWRVPGLDALAETYALDVLAVILGQGRMSRLFRDLREDRGLVRSISAHNLTQKHQGAFYISAQLDQEHIPEVQGAIQNHLRGIQREGVLDEELARIRTQVANRFIFRNEKPSDRANLYGYYYSQLQDLQPAFDYPSLIQGLQGADLQKAAQTYLNPEAFGVVIAKPV